MRKANRQLIDRFLQALPIRVVVDSCVFPRTAKWLIPLTDAARSGYIELFWSPLIIAESNRVLTWLWLKRHGGDLSDKSWAQCSIAAKRMFSKLTRVFRVVDDRPPHAELWDSPSDSWDVPIWTAAKRCEAAFVVTDNLADGPPPDSEGIREYDSVMFAHPDDFLKVLGDMVEQLESRDVAELPAQMDEGSMAELTLEDSPSLLRHLLQRPRSDLRRNIENTDVDN